MNTIQDRLPESIDTLEVLIPDINGQIRGKILRLKPDEDLSKKSLLMPVSALLSDFVGDCITETGMVWETGDPDYPCVLEENSLTVVPWQENTAQIFAQIIDQDGQPFGFDPRAILQNTIKRLADKGLTAITALELEFTLTHKDNLSSTPSHSIEDQSKLYDVREVVKNQPLFNEILAAAKQQGIVADTVISEAAPHQFEINLFHQADALRAVDHAIMLRRLIKAIALKHGLHASFMAKPYADHPGNGMHVHISVCDQAERNIFAPNNDAENWSEHLLHAVAGLQRTMADTVLALFPNINSFKRIAKKAYAPNTSHWGYNNRNVCLRIPSGDPKARRIEHRLAGADANPYLLMNAIIAGIIEGLENPQSPTPITEGNIDENPNNALPSDPYTARAPFINSGFIAEHFGATFQRYHTICHEVEITRYQRIISPLERDWYFTQV